MSAVSDLQGLSDLSQCAYALGVAFGREAQAETDHARRLQYFQLFDRCFHGFRVAVALKLRLTRASGALWRERDPSEAEDLRDGADATDRERAERDAPGQDRDRDSDREAASLPILLKTLNGVVAEAAALPGPHPAELPTLSELLRRMSAKPGTGAASPSREPNAAGVAVLARPPAALQPTARSRLLIGAAPTPLPVFDPVRRSRRPSG